MNSSWSRSESKFGNVMDVSAHVVFKIIFSFSVFASFTSAVYCCLSSTEICGLATSCSKELQWSGNDRGGDGGRGGGGGNSSSVK